MGDMFTESDDNTKQHAELVGRLLTPLFGSLWWIREKFLIEVFKKEGVAYDYESTREGHPHVSLLKRHSDDGRAGVPFLMGSSSGDPQRHVEITGLDSACPDKTTYLGVLYRPVLIGYKAMLSRAEDADSDQLYGNSWERSNIWPNWDRLNLTEEERKGLEQWCERWID